MHSEIERILIPRQRIAQRVAELAAQIQADHSPALLDGGGLTIVPIMTGAMIFCGDLIRHMQVPMKIGIILTSSYPGASTQSNGTNIVAQRVGDVRGRHVVVIDDVLDSGGTLRAVVPILREMGAVRVRTCVLLRKDRPAARETSVDYVGFDIPDEFVVGYGLDYNDEFRNVPDIATLVVHARR